MWVIVEWKKNRELAARIMRAAEDIAHGAVCYELMYRVRSSDHTLCIEEDDSYADYGMEVSGNVITIFGCSSAGNGAEVDYDTETGVITFSYGGTRHALREPGNFAGAVFAKLFYRGEWRDGRWELILETGLLSEGRVVEYKTHAPDREWWECGLIAGPRKRRLLRAQRALELGRVAFGPKWAEGVKIDLTSPTGLIDARSRGWRPVEIGPLTGVAYARAKACGLE